VEFTSNDSNIKARIKIPYILIVLVLIFMAGIRVAQGADFWPYYRLYMGINKYVRWKDAFDAGIEPFYVIISKVLGYFRMPFFTLLTTFAIISVSLKTSTYFKYSPYPMLSLLFFFMPYYFTGDSGHIRQTASVALCIFSYQFIERRQLFKFLLCIFIGYYFHKTAIIFIPAYWIANMYISTRGCIILLIISIILGPFKIYLLFGSLFSSMSSDILSEAVGGYYSYQGMEGGNFSLNDIVKIIFLAIILFNDNYIINTTNDKNYMPMRNLVIFFYFLHYTLKGNIIFSLRLPAAYNDFSIILIAMIIKYSPKNMSRIIYFYIVIFIYLMSWRFWPNSVALGFDKMSNIFNSDTNYFIPYEFVDE
jgi:hypothetical protein